MDIAIMVEGQMGLNWERWQRMAHAVEDLGFAGLYRSDHFTNPEGAPEDSLELWISLAWLADNTSRLEFGPLVTPMSFRDPVFTARMGLHVDMLAGGRLALGVGAGWQAREHEMFGYDLLETDARFARFNEGLEVITRLVRSAEPVSFEGEYYQVREAVLLPKPERPTSILIGGNGKTRTLPLVARFADEWNAVYLSVDQYNAHDQLLKTLLAGHNRDSSDVRRSLMTGLVFGQDEKTFRQRLRGRDATELKAKGIITGTPGDVQEQLARLRESTSLQRVMLQWLDYDDIDGLEALAQAVL